jgi:arginine-tRNA-protein transferase
MDGDDQDQYMQFLLQSRVNSRIVEFRDGAHDRYPGRLRIVSMIDILEQGISSVYTFYDTSSPTTSYGNYSILWQIEQARVLGLPYLYLGYYIKESAKMSYKIQYQPMEGLIDDHWQGLSES